MAAKGKSPESVVRDIKRKNRRVFNAEEKIRIILEGWKNRCGSLGFRRLEISELPKMQTFQMTHLMHAPTGKHGHACCQRSTR